MRLYFLLRKFRTYLQKRGYSPVSIERIGDNVADCVIYLENLGIRQPSGVTLKNLEEYYRDMYWGNTPSGRPYASHTLCGKICAIRSFFRYLLSLNLILINPAQYLKLPRLDRIPKNILSLSEVEALLLQPDLKTYKGIRDRAILELFYSTGIRRNELVCLNIHDPDLKDEILIIRCGKGAKDRIVPLGKWAAVYLKKYLTERKKYEVSDNALFVTCKRDGKRIDQTVNIIVRKYAERAGIEKRVTPHLLRHTCAVHMLEGGADVRIVQELLGHRHIGTTQIYLSVSKEELKKTHLRCHPRGKLDITGNV